MEPNRRRRRRRLLAGLTFVGALGGFADACGTPYASDPSDGGAGSETGADVAETAEAEADASNDADAAATLPPECTGMIDDDFKSDPGTKWVVKNGPGATISLDWTTWVSPPTSLAVTWTDFGGTAFLTKSFAQSAKNVCCDLRIRAGGNGVSGPLLGGVGYALRLNSLNNGTLSTVENLPNDGGTRAVGSLGTITDWRQIRVEVALPPGLGKGTLRISVDGQVALTDAVGAADVDLSLNQLELGLTYSAAGVTSAVYNFDDVHCGAR